MNMYILVNIIFGKGVKRTLRLIILDVFCRRLSSDSVFGNSFFFNSLCCLIVLISVP